MEAEGVCRRIHDDLGLANVLQLMGDLEQGKNHFRQAIDYYENSVQLYEKTKERVGMAYTCSELCCCYAKDGNKEKAIIYEQQVIELCKNLPYESVKRYCMMKIRSALSI